jgi:putative endonuclease
VFWRFWKENEGQNGNTLPGLRALAFSGRRPVGYHEAMNWQVYIIRCSDGSLYTGITLDVERRLSQHGSNAGAKYFRGRRPEAVVYLEGGHSRSTASRREAQIKQLRRAEKLRLIGSDSNEVGGMHSA